MMRRLLLKYLPNSRQSTPSTPFSLVSINSLTAISYLFRPRPYSDIELSHPFYYLAIFSGIIFFFIKPFKSSLHLLFWSAIRVYFSNIAVVIDFYSRSDWAYCLVLRCAGTHRAYFGQFCGLWKRSYCPFWTAKGHSPKVKDMIWQDLRSLSF